MNMIMTRVFLILAALSAFSCGERRFSKSAVEAAEASFPIDSLEITGAPYKLCDQKLTSYETIMGSVPDYVDGEFDYGKEPTPAEEAFFFPEKDIADTPLVRAVQLRYNYAAVLSRLLHGYELFLRKSSADSLGTKKDTLAAIAHDRPVLSSSFLRRAIPEAEARQAAERLISVYRRFDGDDSEGSDFDRAFSEYGSGYDFLPDIVTEDLLDDFQEHFWEWYDKRKHVPEFDRLASLSIDKELALELSEEQADHWRKAIEGERDIDRRTILALEMLRQGELMQDATIYLGEILESGIYTKYILEAWLAWRAGVQLVFFGPSSFTFIPNNYYDQVRVKCLNTLLRHIQTDPDKYDVCLLENFICCEILHRQGSLYGNESLSTLARLTNALFIQPSALGRDYLTEEK